MFKAKIMLLQTRPSHEAYFLIGRVISYIRNAHPYWIHGGEISKKSMEWGFDAENGKRVARKAREEGWLERKFNKKGHVMYRYVPLRKKTPEEIKEEQEEMIRYSVG